jgi:serine/threonine protein kinase/Tol biopolymer transport system component
VATLADSARDRSGLGLYNVAEGMALQPGTTLGPYEIVSLIGAGGMGEVYLAREISLGRNVALKVLPSEFTHDPQRVARFEQEARSASALSHPNICTIHALGELPDGRRFIAMEYVAGETLRHQLNALRFTIHRILDIATQVATALNAAHAAGIIHRDIKPENVMLRPDGFVKVLDFGLAKLTTASESAAAESTQTAFRTDAGAVVGTIAYMSPEQARGQQVDARTDVWALGTVLYEMVAGRGPFTAKNSSDTLAAILEHDPDPLARFDSDVLPELQRIVSKTLRKDREQRYQSMKDVLLDLQALREDLHTQVRSGSSPSVEPAPATRQPITSPGQLIVPSLVPAKHRRLIVATAAVVIAGLLGGVVWWMRTRSSAPAAHTPAAPVQRNLTRLTFGPGLQTDVTFSPDGRFIAYASDRTGNFDIWVQPVAGGQPVQVTKSPLHDIQPDWSPDGSTLVFRGQGADGGLFLIPSLGGPSRRVCPFGWKPKWSPDGKRILFGSNRPISGAVLPVIYSMSAETNQPEPVPQGSWPLLSRLDLWNWRPDGAISVYGQLRSGERAFLTIPPGQSSAPQLNRDGTGLVVQAFCWSADSQAIIVAGGSPEGLFNLWVLKHDPTSHRLIRAHSLTTGADSDADPSLSRDGTKLAFTIERPIVRLWRWPFDAQSGSLLQKTGAPLTEPDSDAYFAAVSRDGRKLAYEGGQRGQKAADLTIRDLVTDSVTRMFVGMPQRDFMVWSNSGEKLAYLRTGWPGARRREVVLWSEVTGETVVPMDDKIPVFIPFSWAPDDSFLIGITRLRNDRSWRVMKLTLPMASAAPATTEVLLADPRYSFFQTRYSPDGRWIAFTASALDSPQTSIGLMSRDGAWHRLTPPGITADKPRWAPSGSVLYFISDQDGGAFNLWRAAINSTTGRLDGKPIRITHFNGIGERYPVDVNFHDPAIGSGVLILPLESVTGSIWMLDNVDR